MVNQTCLKIGVVLIAVYFVYCYTWLIYLQDLAAATGPCPRPENMTKALLIEKMTTADLNTMGTRVELNARYELYDRSKEHAQYLLN